MHKTNSLSINIQYSKSTSSTIYLQNQFCIFSPCIRILIVAASIETLLQTVQESTCYLWCFSMRSQLILPLTEPYSADAGRLITRLWMRLFRHICLFTFIFHVLFNKLISEMKMRHGFPCRRNHYADIRGTKEEASQPVLTQRKIPQQFLLQERALTL